MRELLLAHDYWRHERPDGRSGHPQRAPEQLFAGVAGAPAQAWSRTQPGPRAMMDEPRRRLPASARDLMSEEDRYPPADGRPRGAGRRPGRLAQPARPRRRRRRPLPGSLAARGADPDPTRGRRLGSDASELWTSSTGWAASPPTAASTSLLLRGEDGARRRRGPTSSPIRASASSSPRPAPGTPGRATAARTGSRPGRTTRSPTRPARRSTCATRRPASSGRRRPGRSAPGRAVSSCGTGRATPSSSTVATGSRPELTALRAAATTRSRSGGCGCSNRRRAAAAAVGHGLRRMGAGRHPARRAAPHVVTEVDAGDRRAVRPQRLQQRVRRAGRLRRRR